MSAEPVPTKVTSGDQWVLWEDTNHVAFLDPTPNMAGATVVMCKDLKAKDLWTLTEQQFIQLMLVTKQISQHVTQKLNVQRCAMVADSKVRGHAHTMILPLASLGETWVPVLAQETEFSPTYPGYITTKNGPRADDSVLDEVLSCILQSGTSQSMMSEGVDTQSHPGTHPKLTPDTTFHGQASDDNLFARIVRGELQQWRVWEDREHIAFLTPFPSTPGFTVVVPRTHLSSNILGLPTDAYIKLLLFARTVGQLAQKALNSEGFAIVCEGMEIDYAHVKVIPLHTTDSYKSAEPKYMDKYAGYVTSRPGPPASRGYMDKMHCLLKMQ